MAKNSGTRSGMLWEVERILNECAEIGRLPQILLMENVSQIHSQENISHFQEWIKALDKLGYSSYWKDLNSKDYGIPQNRNRTFMVSILGDWYYEFPKQIPLKLRLKDMLEDEVDEKYYLSDRMIEYIKAKGTANFKNADSKINLSIARPLTTDQNKRAGTTNYLCDELPENIDLNDVVREYGVFEKKNQKHQAGSVYNANGLCPTLDTMQGGYRQPCIEIKENTKKGYAEAYEGDGVYTNRPHQKRGCVQKGMIQTIKTQCDDIAVVVRVGNYSPSGHNASSIVDTKGIAPTVMENHGTITAVLENKGEPICLNSKGGRNGVDGLQPSLQDRVYSSSSSVAITTGFHPSYTDKEELRIRKLTSKECFRLMGVKDEDFEKIAKNQSDSSLYHLAGDSIVVNVLMAIFKELL